MTFIILLETRFCFWFVEEQFLVAKSNSIRGFSRLWVRRSVCPSVGQAFLKKKVNLSEFKKIQKFCDFSQLLTLIFSNWYFSSTICPTLIIYTFIILFYHLLNLHLFFGKIVLLLIIHPFFLYF